MIWYTAEPEGTGPEIDRLAAAWAATGGSAPVENVEVLRFILDTARDQVIAYAPALVEGAPIPDRLVYAQLQQAINLWNAGTVSSQGDLGVEQFTFTPRPLDKTIRSIIRPVSGFSHAL